MLDAGGDGGLEGEGLAIEEAGADACAEGALPIGSRVDGCGDGD